MAKRNGALSKLIAVTTAVAAIGGACYIFRDKIMESSLFQSAAGKANDLCDNVKNKINREDEDDFFFDDDDDFFNDSSPSESTGEREYTSISISASDDNKAEDINEPVDITASFHVGSNDYESSSTTSGQEHTNVGNSIDTYEADSATTDNNSDESALSWTDTTTHEPDVTLADNSTDEPASTWADESTGESASTRADEDTSKPASTWANQGTGEPEAIQTNEDRTDPEAAQTDEGSTEQAAVSDNDSIPTIDFGSTFTRTETVMGYENEGLSDVSEDPDTLEDMDKLDF